VNDAPVAVADTATVLEDAEATSIDVLANDTDEEGDPLTLFSVTTSGTGTVTVNGTLVEYTPAVDFNGTEEVSYTVSDGLLTSAGVLTITVTPVNDAPTITSTSVTTATEDIAYTYTITTEDVDGDVVTVSASGLPSWLTLSGDTLSGTPTEGDTGSEITITATDDGDGALTATQIFTIVVTPVNDAPVAVADTATVLEDAEATSIDVLANDTDEEGDPLTLVSVTTSGTGTVTVNGTLVEYTPAVDFNGTEEVSYTVSDGLLTSAGVLTITVTPVNDAPTITSTSVTTATEDIAYTYTITTEDVDGDVVTVSASGLPSWLTLSGDTLSGTPTEGDTGSEITITATDDGDGALTATQIFTIVVIPVNDAPTITSTAVTTATEDIAYTYTITTEDVDGDVVTVSATGLPSWLTLSGDTLSGTPTEGETGSEITITATDDGDGALTATQIFTIVVIPVNDAPTITSTAVTTATEDIAYTYTITTEDVDGDIVTVSASGLPSWLTLSGNTLSGTPTEGDTGSEITITATDDGDGALTATQIFTIVVIPVNDAPTITSTSVTTATEDIAYTYTITTEDVDGDVVTVSASGLPSWLTLSGNTLSGTPTEGDTGSEITITATDDGDGALTATQIFTIVVTPVNDAPVAVADTATVLEDAEATSIDVLANDTDEEGDPLTLFSVTTSGTGTVTVNGTLVEYTPAVDFNGTEEVSYTVSDGLLTSAGVLTITVTPVNDAPIAIEDIASVLENAFMTSIDVISNDIDVDGDILTLTDVSYSGLGTVVVNVDEFSVDYTPAPNFIGTEVINYSVTDGILSSEGVLKINVITPEEIQITKPELNIPKFFTPNGDGINDTWNIKWNNVSNYRIIEVNIYNRYGKILKKLTSFDNGWDGTYNGKLMPPNDYWVAIKLVPMNETKRIIIETSNFSLIR
jgi:gliding motility-associated-like protein